MIEKRRLTRRTVLQATAGMLGSARMLSSMAAESTLTPAQTRGPFYPATLPLDKDNDLVTVANRSERAKGVITHLAGRVLDRRSRPLAGALVEIWQCDANGKYHHPWDRRNVPLDPNFQGYGRYLTGADGAYGFRTIKPVPYPGRAPHIHFAIRGPGFEPLVTQMYVAGAPENDRDGLLNRIRDPLARANVLVAFKPAEHDPGEMTARFDIVLESVAASA